MQQAQLLTDQAPDSALALLDVVHTVNFSSAERAEYNLLLIQARNNAGLDISSNTEIYGVREYFVRKKDRQKAAWACYFAALVVAGQNPAQAMEYQMEALDFAKNTENKVLQGKILYNMGTLNFNSEWYDHAILRYRQALKIFRSSDHYQREIFTLVAVSNSFLMNRQADSAQYYYQQALQQAYQHEDTTLMVMVYNNMGAAFREQGQPDKATGYSRQALQLAASDDKHIGMKNKKHIGVWMKNPKGSNIYRKCESRITCDSFGVERNCMQSLSINMQSFQDCFCNINLKMLQVDYFSCHKRVYPVERSGIFTFKYGFYIQCVKLQEIKKKYIGKK